MIKVCLPFYRKDTVHPKTWESIRSLPKDKYEWEGCGGTYVDDARNWLITLDKYEPILNPKYEWYLCIDDDIEFKESDIDRLISHDKDIISGLYPRSDCPDVVSAGWWDEEKGIGWNGKLLSPDAKDLKVVDFVPAGFLLIRATVLKKIRYPWFSSHEVSYGKKRGAVHDDVGFCINAAKAGIKIYIDCNVKVTHHKFKHEGAPPMEDYEKTIAAINAYSVEVNSKISQLSSAVYNMTSDLKRMAAQVAEKDKAIAELEKKSLPAKKKTR